MKRRTLTLILFALAVILPVTGQATVSTSGAYPNMVYDSELGVTFAKDANLARTVGFVQSNGSTSGFMTYNDALDFVDYLNEVNYGGFSSWRLPSYAYDELGHLYHDDGITYYTPAPFTNIRSFYWTDEINTVPGDGREFSFLSGTYVSFAAYRFVLPVHDGGPYRMMLWTRPPVYSFSSPIPTLSTQPSRIGQ